MVLNAETKREVGDLVTCGSGEGELSFLWGISSGQIVSSRELQLKENKEWGKLVPEHLLHATAVNTGHEHRLFINTELPFTY